MVTAGKEQVEGSGRVDSAPIPTHLPPQNPEEQRSGNHIVSLEKDLEESIKKDLSDTKKGIEIVRSWELGLNISTFVFGALLVFIAVIASIYKNDLTYGIVFAGIGIIQIIMSFSFGAMRKTRTSTSDLIIDEIAYLNYHKQMKMWNQYSQLLNDGLIDKSNIEKAAEKMQECTKDTIEIICNKKGRV
jgi:hypothetical protein